MIYSGVLGAAILLPAAHAAPDTPEYIIPSPLFKTPSYPTPDESIAAESPMVTPASSPSAADISLGTPAYNRPNPAARTPAFRQAQEQARFSRRTPSPGTPSLKRISMKKKKKATPSPLIRLPGIAPVSGKRQSSLAEFFPKPGTSKTGSSSFEDQCTDVQVSVNVKDQDLGLEEKVDRD